MPNYKKLYMDYMTKEGIYYTDVSERRVRVNYNGDNLKQISINVDFDKDGQDMCSLYCWTIANFKNNPDAGIKVCNTMNDKYKWVKFYLDKDFDILAQVDTYVDEPSCGYILTSLVKRMVNIIDGAYPEFMKTLWK